MKKVKVVKLLCDDLDITLGKTYDVVRMWGNDVVSIKDDINEENKLYKYQYEEVKEPNYVMVRYGSHDEWTKRILLHDLGEQFKYRYITVVSGHEDDFINGVMVNCISSWRYMKPINKVEQKIEQLEQELAELKQQLNK